MRLDGVGARGPHARRAVWCGVRIVGTLRARCRAGRVGGGNAFRFSVSWSRVEPAPGRYRDAALDRYGRLVDRLNAIGLEPIVTLFHYTHPLWFHQSAISCSSPVAPRKRHGIIEPSLR